MEESEHAQQLRARLEAVRWAPWLDSFDREFIANRFQDEPSLDYLSAITARRIDKILKEAEFQRLHPNAQWS
jgi:hypothetical protein